MSGVHSGADIGFTEEDLRHCMGFGGHPCNMENILN